MEVIESRKQKLQHSRGTETAAALQMEKTFHRETALEQDNSQWTGENRLLEPASIPLKIPFVSAVCLPRPLMMTKKLANCHAIVKFPPSKAWVVVGCQ